MKKQIMISLLALNIANGFCQKAPKIVKIDTVSGIASHVHDGDTFRLYKNKNLFISIRLENIDAPEEYFDIIICADVLEHLADPSKCIAKISRHLKSGGRLIASIPNIREFKTLFNIAFRGDFKYEVKGGILDNTHLRFFCKKNILQLMSTDSLSPVYCKPNFLLKAVPQGRKRRLINRLTFGVFLNFLAIQYLCVAEKK